MPLRDDRPRPTLDGLSIVLPCREAEGSVTPAIQGLLAAARRTSSDYEIVAVDDGSSDGTARSIARFVDGGGPVRLLVHAHRRGYGAAVRTGLGAARMPWVLVASVDEALDASDMAGLAERTSAADMVAGWRPSRSEAVSRRVAVSAWNRLMRALFDLPLHDVACPFKLIRRDVLDRVELRATGPVVAAELVLRCSAQGARVAEYRLLHQPLDATRRPVHVGEAVQALSETARRQPELRRLARVR